MSQSRDASDRIPLRTQLAVYLTGAFGNSTENVTSVIIPLWAVSLGGVLTAAMGAISIFARTATRVPEQVQAP